MTELERRYERLLRLYPAAYRQTRGAEMLAVLLDSAPADRRRPEWRQVRGLIVGALRIRAGAHERRSVGQSWRMALRTAALMLMMETLGVHVARIVFSSLSDVRPVVTVAVALACLLAMVAVFRGAYLAATLVMTGAFVFITVAEHGTYHSLPWQLPWQLPLAVALVMPLIGRRRVVVPRALNLIVPLPLLSIALDVYGMRVGNLFLVYIAPVAVYVTLAVAAILWSTVDERVAMSFGLAYLSVYTSTIIGRAMLSGITGNWSRALQSWGILMALSIVVAVIAIAVGATVGARRARV